MKPKHVVTVAKTGAIYIPKLTTKYLGIFGWAGVVIAVEKTYIYMRFYKHSITPKEGEIVVKLQKKSGGRQAMTGGCRKFSEAIKSDFGDANYLDLHIKVVFVDEESVRISLDRPSRKDEESTPEFADDKDTGCEEKAEANEDETGKDAQAEVARWIRRNGCTEVSCSGAQWKFAGTKCPLKGGLCGRRDHKERWAAENWLISNGYTLDQETSLGTVSNPLAEKQLGIFDLPGSKVGGSPRTRPLPEGLPEWLSGPLSRGEQVRIFMTCSGATGWALGAYISPIFGNERPLVVVLLDSTEEPNLPDSFVIEAIEAFPSRLKPAVECFKIAEKLCIGLSLLQIKAINNGGVPPESHCLPDDMFE